MSKKPPVPVQLPPYTVARNRGGNTVYFFQVPPSRKLTLPDGSVYPKGTPSLGTDPATAIERGRALFQEYTTIKERLRAEGHAEHLTRGSIPWLIRKYTDSARFADLAPLTQAAYKRYFDKIEAWSATAGHPHVSQFRPKVIREFIERFYGHNQQRLAWNALRLLMAQAVHEEELPHNLMSEMDPPRKSRAERMRRRVPPTRKDYEAVCAQAIQQGRWSIALALTFAVELAQREEDALRWQRSWETVIDGRPCVVFQQSKTGKRMVLALTDDLQRMIERAERAGAVQHTQWRVINEHTGRPYDERADRSNSVFARSVRKIAEDAGVTGFKPGMMRHLGVLEMARAGLTVPQIASRTGHTIKSAHKIIEHYLPEQEKLALDATLQLQAWRKEQK